MGTSEAGPVELRYRLIAATMFKPGHYATCVLDEGDGQWFMFDGCLRGEGQEGPRGRGFRIPPPDRAASLGGEFWTILLYARVQLRAHYMTLFGMLSI